MHLKALIRRMILYARKVLPDAEILVDDGWK